MFRVYSEPIYRGYRTRSYNCVMITVYRYATEAREPPWGVMSLFEFTAEAVNRRYHTRGCLIIRA